MNKFSLINVLRKICMTAAFTLCTLALFAQGVNITGTVSDNTGAPLPGATVQVKGTNSGTVADANGKFSITVPDDNAVLVFSFVGYGTQEITVGSQRDITVALSEGEQLEGVDIVVDLGYGTRARQQDLSGAVGVVNNLAQIKERGVDKLLQSQVPGVVVRGSGGDPTKGNDINIRGIGSKSGEGVLTVVDGVPGGNYLIDDVESVVVLKDAASAAIYGAHTGAAGVILITTKKAKAGKTAVSYDGRFGLNVAMNLPHGLNAEELIELRKLSLGDGWEGSGWNPANNPWIGTTRTDWTDEVFRNAFSQSHTLTLSGGTETFSNRLSVNYYKGDGTMINTYSKGMQIRYNASYNIFKFLKLSEDAWVTTSEGRGLGETDGYAGRMLRVLAMPPSAEAYYADGSIGGTVMDPRTQEWADYVQAYGDYTAIHGDIYSPLRGLVDKSGTVFDRPLRFRSTTNLELKDIIKGLRFNSRFTYYTERGFKKSTSTKRWEPGKPEDPKDPTDGISYESFWLRDWEWENILNYDRTFGDHTVGAMAAVTAKAHDKKNYGASAKVMTSDELPYQYFDYVDETNGVWPHPGDGMEIDRNMSLVGRLAYSYADRYFVTGSWRRDYAGKLAADKQYGDFPAVTAAWKLTSEEFMPKTDVLTLFKLRGSWGRIGNLGSIGYNRSASIKREFNAQYGTLIGKDNPYGVTVQPADHSYNPFLTWETSEQTDFGVDTRWLNNRLSFSMDWFHKRTFNLIRQQDFGSPDIMGIRPAQINDGEITNTGFEFSAGWNDRIGEDFSYYVTANLATLKNSVTNIGRNVDPVTGEKAPWLLGGGYRVGGDNIFRSYEGDPYSSIYAKKMLGLFQSDEEVQNYKSADGKVIQPDCAAGDVKFEDFSGPDGKPDGIIDDVNDLQNLGKYFPDITYAMTAGLTWKQLSFSFMLQGIAGSTIWHPFKGMILDEEQGAFNRWNKILDAWPKTSDVPRINGNESNNFGNMSGYYVESGDYMRLKNITLTYTFDNMLHKVKLFNERRSSLMLTFSIDNVLTFTKYTGIDPENGGNDQGSYPIPRVFSLGVKLNY